MLPRLVRFLVTAAGSLLLCLLLLALASPNASSATGGRAQSPAITATPTETPIPEPTDWIRTTANVTPSATTMRVGESITVSAEMAVTGTCDYPIYDVTLRSADPLFAFTDPPSNVIGPPGPNPAVWKVQALQTGATTFTVAFYGETNCGGFWQWHYTWGESPAVTVTTGISSSANLPALYKATTLNVPAAYKLQSYVPPAPPPPSPKYTDLGTLGGLYSAAYDVNDRGQVVGASSLNKGDDTSRAGHAFLWQNGKMKDLGTLGGPNSYALRINELGQIVGNSKYGAGEDEHAFFWSSGRMTDIGTLGGTWSRAVDLNDQGRVVGVSSTAAGQTHCFLWAAGVMTDLGTLGGAGCNVVDINNHGQIVGDSTPAGATSDYFTHAFLWESGTMADLTPDQAPDQPSCAIAMNERGQVIGTRTYCLGGAPFLWDNGTFIDLSSEGQGFDRLDALNDLGQVVGYGYRQCNCQPGGSPYCCTLHALLWDRGILIDLDIQQGRWPNGPTLLNNRGQIVLRPTFSSEAQLYLWQNGVLVPFEVPGGSPIIASAINDAGAVVGYGDHALLWQIASAAK
ncbi:MAG: hypothetical protein U0X20_28630 [Caldilineaceae bacterium]